MRIAFIGHGNVGGALAVHLRRLGHEVTLAARDAGAERVRALVARSPGLAVATPADGVRGAEVVVLATPHQASREALGPVAPLLAGKVLVDCTNPVGPGLTHGLGSRQSGTEAIQALLPELPDTP